MDAASNRIRRNRQASSLKPQASGLLPKPQASSLKPLLVALLACCLLFPAAALAQSPPTVIDFVPAQAENCEPLVGALVVGSDFVDGATVTLSQAGQADIAGTNVVFVSASYLLADFDVTGVAAGFWDATVTNPDTQSGTLADALEVTECPVAPVVTGFDPSWANNCGPLTGATISGSDFVAGATVKLTMAGEADIAGTNVVFVSASLLQADFAIAGAALGFWDATVTNPDTQSGTLVDALEVIACLPPTVTGFDPAQAENCGPLIGATITGSNFGPAATVMLHKTPNGLHGSNVNVQSSTTITADFDLDLFTTTGFWDVQVTNPDPSGTGVLFDALEVIFCVLPPPEVTGFTPDTDVACQHVLLGAITGDEYFHEFFEYMTVRLTRAGEPDIPGAWFSKWPADPVLVDFWVNKGTGTGAWDLVVTNPEPDGQSETLADAVTIVADPACPFGAVGDLYIVSNFRKVMQFDGATGDLVGDFVPAGYGGLGIPVGLTFAPDGNLLVTSVIDPAGVFEYDADTGAFVREFVPGSTDNYPLAASGWLSSAVDVVTGPDGNVYVVSRNAGFVNKYDGQTGEWIDYFAIGGPGPGLDTPYVLRFGPNGNLLVGYGGNHGEGAPQFRGVAEFHGATGRFVRAFGFGGELGSGTATAYWGLEFAPDGAVLAVEAVGDIRWQSLQCQVVAFDYGTGAPLGTLIPPGAGGMGRMERITLGPNGNLFVDGNDQESWGTVVEFDAATGQPVGTFIDIGSQENPLGSNPNGLEFKPAPPDPLPPPAITGVSVGQHDACEPLTGVTVSGANLDETATTVKLSRAGGDPPYPDYVGIVTGGGGTSLTVDFRLDGGIIASGPWDVVAINPDGQSDTLAGAVQMTGCRAARSGNLLATATRRRGHHTPTGIIEYDGGQGDVVGWLANDRFAVSVEGELSFGNGMEYGPNGNLFVAANRPGADPDARYVIEFDGVSGQRLGEFVPAGSGGLLWPWDLTFGPSGNLFVLHHEYPAGNGLAGVLEYDGLTGAFVRTFVAMGDCGLDYARKLVFGPNGNLFVSTDQNGVIEFDGATGACLGPFVAPTDTLWPGGIVFSPHTGNLLAHKYVSYGESQVLEYDGASGALLGTFVQPGACGLGWTPYPPTNANGIEFGPDGNLYLSSAGWDDWGAFLHARVLRFDGRTGDDCGEFAFHQHERSQTSQPYELAFVPIPGDGDGDWDVDLADFARLQQCFGSGAGPGAPGPDDYWCLRFDFDRDGDVDADDLPGFARELTGPQEPTPSPPGACCLPDGTCVEEVAGVSECFVQYGGVFQGQGTTCDTPCPPTGVCCLPDGTCAELTLFGCDAAGGMYQGDGTDCATTECPYGAYSNEIDPMVYYAYAGAGLQIADDMTLAGTEARDLEYLDLRVYGGDDGAFDVTVELWTDCPGDGGTLIPGTTFTWTGVPDDGYVYELVVDPVSPAVTIPDTVWMTATFTTPSSGWIVAEQAEFGFTEDLYGHNDPPWVCNHSWGGNPYAGLWANLRCEEGGGKRGDGKPVLRMEAIETPVGIEAVE